MIRITVAYATPHSQKEIEMDVEEGCTAFQAIERSNMVKLFPEITLSKIFAIGIFGKKVSLETVLKNGDRVEIYRSLKRDPKQARRLRARKR